MAKLSCFLILSILGNFVKASNFRDDYSDDERPQSKSKRLQRWGEYHGDCGINTMTSLFGTTGLDTVFDPAMMNFYSSIVGKTDREISEVVDQAFYAYKFEELKFLEKRGLLEENVTEDHLTLLCRSSNPISIDILKYLFDNEIAVGVCKKGLSAYLMTCSIVSFEKFILFWNKFEGHSLPVSSLANILLFALNNRMNRVYDLILSSIKDSNRVKEILGKSLSYTVINSASLEALSFFMSKSVPFKNYLSLNSRISILNLAAQSCNRQLTEYVLREENMTDQLMKSKRLPWLVAVEKDCPSVLEVYIENIPQIDLENLIKVTFFTKTNHKIIDYFKKTDKLNQDTLMSIAKYGIDVNHIELVMKCIFYGLEVNNIFIEEGMNLFNYAVIRNDLRCVDLFIKECAVDINRVYERQIDSSIVQIFTSLYFVNSKEMVELFYSYGADLNYVHTSINSEGDIVLSGTKMVMAAKALQVGVYQTLRARGANPLIPDERGATAEEIFDGLDDLYD